MRRLGGAYLGLFAVLQNRLDFVVVSTVLLQKVTAKKGNYTSAVIANRLPIALLHANRNIGQSVTVLIVKLFGSPNH